MSDVVFGFFACIAFIVIVLFNVGAFTPNWLTVHETPVSFSTPSFNCSTPSVNCSNPSVNISTPSVNSSAPSRICNYGLFHSVNCPNNENAFDWTIIGLNIATSVCLTAIPFFWVLLSCMLCCCKKDDSDDKCADGCCSCYTFFYAAGGILGFASTLIVVSKFDHNQLGWSFFLTVVSSSVILLQLVLLVTYFVCSRKMNEKCTVFLVYRRRHSNYYV
ncbi:uncharacterized protein LOC133201611 [Saccostrea echinata]|uniref:uncharacterized protein LOC133201611 n=1 Tax=Saccostrea echinata TaxID=191078 RepID=UPI002A83C10E|nr:uncharacterized protein LOC133201611 [Saccostrea echinata]